MDYRRFGRTGLDLSVASLGTMRFESQAAASQTLSKAIAAGINHIETARGYGNSEAYVGSALRSLDVSRRSLYITSKVLPTADAAAAERAIDESLRQLGLDYLDALALHGVNTDEHLRQITNPNGCMAAVQTALQDGRVHHVGFSTHGSLTLILQAIETGLFDFINLHYYLLFQRNAAAIALAYERDMGIFIISPADKGGQLYSPPQTLIDICYPYSPLELSYRFLLSDPRITTLSIGPSTPDELREYLDIPGCGALMPDEVDVLRRLSEQSAQRLGMDQCQQCYQCLPCPEAIHIPEVLRLRNLAVAYDMVDYGRYRYGMFENAGHWFPGRRGVHCTDCGDCLPRCPENLSIPNLVRDADARLKGKPRRRLWDD